MTIQNCKVALSYWNIGMQYLHLVETVAEKTSETGNQFIVVSTAKLNEDEYTQQTLWADHALVIPLLFDFYHGIEVLLKGFLIAKGCRSERNHRLSKLLDKFNTQFPLNDLNSIIERYIQSSKLVSPLNEFCHESNISIDEYYLALKYPQSKAGNIYEHSPLKYNGRRGLKFFEGLVQDIRRLRTMAVLLGRSICPLA